jgi:hypothetical protein
MQKKTKSISFSKQLKKYISIKGLEMVIHLVNGEIIELHIMFGLKKIQ